MATAADEDPDECVLCLDDLVDPRFLPCHHTFCATCIEDLASSHDGKTFPCPACRKETSLPAGGVAALQRNFYIKPAKKPRDATRCKTHEDQVLKFYCVPCERVICTDCKLTEHEQHPTQDLQKAAEIAKRELSGHGERFQQALGVLARKVDAIQIHKKDLLAKQSQTEKTIHDRHAMLVAQANKERDESVSALRSANAENLSSLDKHLKQEEQNVQQLLRLQDQVNTTVAKGTGVGILTAARQMKRGRGSELAVRRMTSAPTFQYDHLVLRQHTTMEQITRKFMGSLIASRIAEAELKIVNVFNCNVGARIIAVGYADRNPPCVKVSFEQSANHILNKEFTEGGVCLKKKHTTAGELNYKRYAKGLLLESDKHTVDIMYRMVKAPAASHLQLETRVGSGTGKLVEYVVRPVKPFKIEATGEYLINVNANRAVDVDATEQVFVVVEEPRAPASYRRVLMYRRPGLDPICSYTPPIPTCQPSDVCFYKLGGHEVLLVADETNNAIHVVSIAQNKFTFLRYLTSGCSRLVQPTAMNVDLEGRLWVACANGDILTIKPKN